MKGGRHLLWEPWENCSSPAVIDFPYPHDFPHGWIIFTVAIILLVYSYIELSRICDTYFVPSLNLICQNLGITGDLAGVCVLASAGSAPELALSLFSTFITQEGEIGVNSIVGSSVFNTLAIPAICALVITAGGRHLLWEPWENCSSPAVIDFPYPHDFPHGWIIFTVAIILLVYSYIELSRICDTYFVPSLNLICQNLGITGDLAGVCVLASAGSAPELALSLFSTFITQEGEIGVNSIVGSSVFNTLAIPAICALVITAGGRHLLWEPWENCSSPAVIDFPYPHDFPHGWIIFTVAIILLVYSYIELSRICDTYFVPSLNLICQNLGITGDLAGVCVLASAGSAPELALSLFSTFITQEGEIGVNSIVGSSVFNTLAIPAICALVITAKCQCDPWSLTRNVIMTAVSLSFILFSLNDDKVYWFEALLMILLYVIYIIVLYFINKINDNGDFSRRVDYSNSPLLSGADYILIYGKKSSFVIETSTTSYPKTKKIFHILTYPTNLIIKNTIPKPNLSPYRACIISVFWIAGLTYIITWMITIIGYKLNLPDALMGLTILAIGLGVPDLFSSLIVAKEGDASMALSNTLGSNIFNILVCLGLPWLIKAIFLSDGEGHYVDINTDGILYSVFTILGTLGIEYAVIAGNDFRLNKFVGLTSVFLYGFFVLLVSLFEMNVFFDVNLPLCNTKDFYLDR